MGAYCFLSEIKHIVKFCKNKENKQLYLNKTLENAFLVLFATSQYYENLMTGLKSLQNIHKICMNPCYLLNLSLEIVRKKPLRRTKLPLHNYNEILLKT
jgi:hypothetical protein